MTTYNFPPTHPISFKDRSFLVFTEEELASFKIAAEALVDSIFLDNNKIFKVEGKALELSMPTFRWPLKGQAYLKWGFSVNPGESSLLYIDEAAGTNQPLRDSTANIRRRQAHNLDCVEKILAMVEEILVTNP